MLDEVQIEAGLELGLQNDPVLVVMNGTRWEVMADQSKKTHA